MSLRGRNAVITGATRGIGRGIAIACGELGANVFITGRTETALQQVSELVQKAGGNCEYIVVDHANDNDIKKLFEYLESHLRSNGNTLDLFVNNAYAAVDYLMKSGEIPFWKKDVNNPTTPNAHANPGDSWDIVNGVGLRNNYVCAAHALRMMEPQAEGLIVNITSWAGMISIFDPAYAIGKEAVERMSGEIALAAPEGIKSFALCPGFVTTDSLMDAALKKQEQAEMEGDKRGDESFPLWNAETPLFVGRVLAALASDKGVRYLPKMNGKVVMAVEAAELLDIYDENGFRPLSPRGARFQAMMSIPYLRTSSLRKLIPRTLYAPWTIVRAMVEVHTYWN